MRHWFLPHPHTHKKATLISWEGILIYILLFMLLQVSFSITNYLKPGVLGVSSNIEYKKIIELTNAERARNGLPPVIENSALNKAAALKAANMFSEDYWSHFAPSGKSPWDFILSSGYQFSFAGENLAKNFSDSDGVVKAWMASPSHKENILNSKYQEIGIAVVDGELNGQKTTLVVQMFGTTKTLAAKPEININGEKIALEKQEYNKSVLDAPVVLAAKPTAPLVDPYLVLKTFGFGVILIITSLLALDFIILRRRQAFRLTSHHFAHFSFLSVTAIALASTTPGSIL